MSGAKKKGCGRVLTLVIEALCVAVFLYAAFRLYLIIADYKTASSEYDRLAKQAVSSAEAIEYPERETGGSMEEDGTAEVFYGSADIEGLKAVNPDTVGWIILPDSRINYPIVKSSDNTEYLTRTFEGKKASSGAVFMDMYCESDFSSTNTIIYGHNMKNGSMFRALNNMTGEEYFNGHRVFYIDTGDGFKQYEIISCYATTEEDLSSWKISFADTEEYEEWLLAVSRRCRYECAEYDVQKNTVTLSTCRGKSGGTGRFIVHLQEI